MEGGAPPAALLQQAEPLRVAAPIWQPDLSMASGLTSRSPFLQHLAPLTGDTDRGALGIQSAAAAAVAAAAAAASIAGPLSPPSNDAVIRSHPDRASDGVSNHPPAPSPPLPHVADTSPPLPPSEVPSEALPPSESPESPEAPEAMPLVIVAHRLALLQQQQTNTLRQLLLLR